MMLKMTHFRSSLQEMKLRKFGFHFSDGQKTNFYIWSYFCPVFHSYTYLSKVVLNDSDKGQKISEGNCGIFNSLSKKNEKICPRI